MCRNLNFWFPESARDKHNDHQSGAAQRKDSYLLPTYLYLSWGDMGSN